MRGQLPTPAGTKPNGGSDSSESLKSEGTYKARDTFTPQKERFMGQPRDESHSDPSTSGFRLGAFRSTSHDDDDQLIASIDLSDHDEMQIAPQAAGGRQTVQQPSVFRFPPTVIDVSKGVENPVAVTLDDETEGFPYLPPPASLLPSTQLGGALQTSAPSTPSPLITSAPPLGTPERDDFWATGV